MKEYVTLKREDYKYPSQKEFLKHLKKCPRLEIFDFRRTHPLALIVNDRIPMNEASRLGNLYWWDNCFLYRLEKVRDSYIYTMTNYYRGFLEDYFKCTHKQLVNHFQFNYYAEIFYYYYFSTRDIIAQILNSYYLLGIKENKVLFNKLFINKILDPRVKNILIIFEEETKDSNDYRNGFTHRFTPNIPDHRSTIVEGNKKLDFYGGRYIESDKMIKNINDSINSLSKLILELKEFVQ
jgi:hypothetical protein